MCLTEVDEAEALATASSSDPRGHLRVLCPPAFAVHQLAKHLKVFRARYPMVFLELTVPGPIDTVDENFDVTILTEGARPARRQLRRAPPRSHRGHHLRQHRSTSICAAGRSTRASSSTTRRWCPTTCAISSFHTRCAVGGQEESFTIERPRTGLTTTHDRHAVRGRARRHGHHRPAVVRRRGRAARERAGARPAALASAQRHALRRHADAQARAGADAGLRRFPGRDLSAAKTATRGSRRPGCETRLSAPSPRRLRRAS